MRGSFSTVLWVLLYSFAAGVCLALFGQIEQLYKFLFSLLAIYIGFLFFRRFETIGVRITFVAAAIAFYFLTMLIMELYKFLRDNPELLTSSVL